MNEPTYHLIGVMRSNNELPADFDGPLAVILQLLSKNKIDIEDVSISSILEQYLAYLDEMKAMDMEIASEFIAMASHLMLIKTKMLLSAAEAAEAESELDVLRQSLIDRQRKEAMEQIRMAITVLEPRNDVGRCMFVKEPEPLKKDNVYRYQHVPEDLLRALDNISERNQRRLPPPTVNFKGIVGKEPYPVTKKASELVRVLILRGIQSLKNLFKGNRSRSEIVATFLAVLELCKTNNVSIDADDSGENPNVRLIQEPKEEKEVAFDGTN